MARIRTIKPEFFKNEQLAELPMIARMLFIGLWTQADRRGRLLDRPKRIKAEVLPYDKADVDQLLTSLQEAGLIIRYECQGFEAIQILSFEKHQRFSGKEAQEDSYIPEHKPGSVGEVMGKQQGSNGEASENAGKEGKGREGNKEGKGKEFSGPTGPGAGSEADDSPPSDSTTQPPDEKEKGCAQKEKGKREPKEVTPHWKALVAEWYRFYRITFHLEPVFSGEDASALKRLVGKIQAKLKAHEATKDEEWTEGNAVNWLQKFLTKSLLDPWLRDHFRLANIDSQFNEIAIRNGKPTSKAVPGQSSNPDYERRLAERIQRLAGKGGQPAG